ncbi:topoisomerase IV [uncultured Paraglaciecola sp.]|uniref:topoisomerase IV n=1 Tax=uncultured Paraglaciecola sp. TaxID=1765024 RepID=UPI0030DAC218|tara:strand:- start:218 stop:1345 length:1128 start_codon:yes stop_codon:yes gene_type:complete
MKNLSKTVVLLTSLGFAAAASAEVRINGFANLIGGITSSDDALYGYDDSLSFKSESSFALQVSGDINDKMTATGQIIARGEDDYDAEFEWAYFTFNATDHVSISAGRLRLPLFKYSASRDVGYSYHWVNTPRAVYAVPFNNLDGVRVDYANYAGDWEYNFQLAVGTFSGDNELGDIEGKNVVVGTAELQRDWFKARVVAGRGKTTLNADSVSNITNALAQISPELADDLDLRDDSGLFLGVGLEADFYDWFISGEFTTIDVENSFSPEDKAFYITAGMRFGAFTPSMTYEKLDGRGDIRFLDKVAVLPAGFQAAATAAVVGLQQAVADEYDVFTLGVRYDYDTNIALKADISSYTSDIDDSLDTGLLRFAVNYIF